MLIHAHHRWPQAVTHHHWPYALRMANSARNSVAREFDQPYPLELFNCVKIQNNVNHFHTFGCPVFAHEPKTSKWEERARMGQYLGTSPNHAKSAALVLSLQTGLVSPQFHVSFDKHFQTVKDIPIGVSHRWTYLAGLNKDEEVPSSPFWTVSPTDNAVPRTFNISPSQTKDAIVMMSPVVPHTLEEMQPILLQQELQARVTSYHTWQTLHV